MPLILAFKKSSTFGSNFYKEVSMKLKKNN